MVNDKFFRFLIYTNLLIALSALAQCALTYQLFQTEYNFYIVLIEGTSTLLLYNFSLLLSKPKHPERSIYARTKWFFSHSYILYINSFVSLTVLFYCLLHVSLMSFGFLTLIGLISLLYSLPFIKHKGTAMGLRNIPYFKLFHIALIWTLSSVILPVIELNDQGIYVSSWQVGYLAMMKFVLLLICTLPFDIRDAKQDALYLLKTIPTYFGIEKAKQITYLLLALHTLLIIFSPFIFGLKMGLLLCNAIVLLMLKFAVFKNKSDYHQVYLLDLFLFLQFFIVFTINLILNGL